MNEFIIRRATRADFPALGVVGVASYAESYCYAWEDPAGYAAQLQSFAQGTFEQMPVGTSVWVVETQGWIVGFLKMLANSPDPIERRAPSAEIQRIYLLKPCRGLGLGLKLLERAEGDAKLQGSKHLWLALKRSATWARRAYEGWGFRIIGEREFEKPVIPSERTLVVMRRNI